uniref:Uncharacterized protein n=1 Tax=uncultured Alphaproteobacteria bacterium TaxID=91750 RepID=A0A6G8F1U5_9PROT|nr:hypothetical protein PlAlph_0080 [uncultured Alphaproteobacteria bacterium]
MFYRSLLFVMFLAVAAPVKAAEVYGSIVNVDVSDVNAAAAKEKAMAQANREALNHVAPQVASPEGIELLNSLSDDQILYFIKEAMVLSEKSSDVRYIASLKITIQDNVLRQYLAEKGVAEELPRGTIDALYIFPALSDWLIVEKKVNALKGVDMIETVAMTRRKVQFRISYSGSFDDLQQSLKGLNLSLGQNGSIYVLETFASAGE